MRVFGFVFVFVAIVFLVGVVPAEAQYGQSPAERLIQGNLQMVNNSQYYGGDSQYSPQYGQSYQAGYEQQQPYYQQQSQPQRRMGTLERAGLGGAIGALGSRMITKNSKVVAGAALGGILIGALTGRQKNPQGQQASYQPQLASNNMGAEPWPTQQDPQYQQSQQQGAVVTVKNCTRFQVEVYDWDTPIGTLQPGESAQISASTRGGYRALASISLGGQTTRSWADTRFVDSTGSILFVEPK